jgi:protocatechuate 3,4-dioxygenase beta subunit
MKYLLNFSKMFRKQLKFIGICALFNLLFAWNMSANIFSQLIYFEGTGQNTSIKEVLKAIERQTEYTFFYNDAFVDLNRPVHVEQQTVEVGALLSRLFKDTNLTYREQDNNFIVITPKEQLQQGIAVSGTVTDETGEPLPGVNIMVKGSTIGIMSDADGR